MGGATGAAMAAIVMSFEMTLDYTVIVPMTLTVAISYAIRRSVIWDSIYTRKLTLRGESVPETLRADLQFTRRASSIMNSRVEVLPSARRLQDLAPNTNDAYIVTDESGAVAGAVTGEVLAILYHAKSTAMIGEIAERTIVVSAGDSLWMVVAAICSTSSTFALVAPSGSPLAIEVQGMISRKEIVDTLASDIDLIRCLTFHQQQTARHANVARIKPDRQLCRRGARLVTRFKTAGGN